MTTITLPELSLDDCLQPDWRVAPRVRALVSTRDGGVSAAPYGRWSAEQGDAPGGMNLGLHTGDDPAAVEANRARLLA
ncbi:laccase domain-containing protein, partial [Burkholderia gladioli]